MRAGRHDLSGQLMSGKGLITGCGEGSQTGFDSGDSRVGDDRRKGTGFISHHEIEQRLVGNRMGAMVVCKFCMGNRFGPRCGVIAAEDSEIHKSQLPGLLTQFRHLSVGDRQWRRISRSVGVFRVPEQRQR